MEEDGDAEDEEARSSVTSRHDTPTHDDVFNPLVTDENRKAEHDFLLLEAQRILGSVRKAEESLRKRHAELRQLNETYITQVEEINTQLTVLETERENSASTNKGLRNDNVALKREMAVSGHELLWLKMQFQALKLEVRAGDAGAERLTQYAPQLRDDIQSVKRERFARRWKAWEDDWQDVERRLGRRRRRYDSFAAAEEDVAGGVVEDTIGDEESGGWVLDKVTEQDGKMQRIVLTRVLSHHSQDVADEDPSSAEEEEDATVIIEEGIIESIEEESPEPNSGEDPSSPPTLLLVTDLPTIETFPSLSPRPPTSYEDTATQTPTSAPSLTSTSSWVFAEADTGAGAEDAEDECAITTSPPSEVDVDEFSDEEATTPRLDAKRETGPGSPGLRTAWQELWTGLTHLAGMEAAE